MSTTMPSLGLEAAPMPREQHVQEPQPRLGLALSGGGFRAAFFHIGVLARLAELEMLRHVQVISTVSGGSIIGALYYIYLKNLLEQHADLEINRDHYLKLIDEMEKRFTFSVQTNIRMRIFDSLLANLHMASARYSRTDRIGELLDEHLYRPAYEVGREDPVMMNELKINPALCDVSGKHKFDPLPKGRNNVVPQLLLNATELNTGHTWRFEAIQMGEPDRDRRLPEDQHLIFREIDTGLRLRRIKYECHRDKVVRVGRAAAASAAVPTIFPPFPISELYPNVINLEAGSRYLRVQLTDGGVHDNQGINALRHRECTHFIVSDASGQLEDEAEPETGAGAVLRRSMDILMDRVREEQLFWLKRNHPGRVALMHLRKENPTPIVNPAGPENQAGADEDVTSFGVRRNVQERLARLRTDLDAFTDVEAFSLMTDGYLMTASVLRDLRNSKDGYQWKGLMPEEEPSTGHDWRFLVAKRWMSSSPSPEASQYLRQLEIGQHRFFKLFRWNRPLAAALGILGGIVSIPVLYFLLKVSFSWYIPLGAILIGLLVLLLSIVFLFLGSALRAFKMTKAWAPAVEKMIRYVTASVSAPVLWAIARFHLRFINPGFLRMGTVDFSRDQDLGPVLSSRGAAGRALWPLHRLPAGRGGGAIGAIGRDPASDRPAAPIAPGGDVARQGSATAYPMGGHQPRFDGDTVHRD